MLPTSTEAFRLAGTRLGTEAPETSARSLAMSRQRTVLQLLGHPATLLLTLSLQTFPREPLRSLSLLSLNRAFSVVGLAIDTAFFTSTQVTRLASLCTQEPLEQRGPQENAGLDAICQDEVGADTASDCPEASIAVRGCGAGAESALAGRSQFRKGNDAGDSDGAPHRAVCVLGATGRRAELP
uniref:Uncharacterized protein n=1 Tax=Rangifer tarandus platyrhynchus TaxID=3082113 RepID=A0ACB0F570_RANTA|nr:unnamed protein product [Rangifer tarandus platyrhynchus]